MTLVISDGTMGFVFHMQRTSLASYVYIIYIYIYIYMYIYIYIYIFRCDRYCIS